MEKLIMSVILSLLPFLLACQSGGETSLSGKRAEIDEEHFGDYWYSGKAEVASYRLKQSRYGETREGSAILIFVTEPFSRSKQVKLDDPGQAGNDQVTVMKLNMTKEFTTGIYPYSMMLSAFTPVDTYYRTLKTTMSSQEWCGQVFSQLNLDNGQYQAKSYSYFEQEGDQESTLGAAILEDGLWNMIKLDYKSMPIGEINIIPGLFYTRLQHQELQPEKAIATLQEEGQEATYSIQYTNRILNITFSKAFPYHILSWNETFNGPGGKLLTTIAVLDRKLHIDYWTKNKNAHSHLRDSLNLKE